MTIAATPLERASNHAIHVLPKHRLAYVAVPKVASSTIKLALWRWLRDDPAFFPRKPKTLHDKARSPFNSPNELGLTIADLASPDWMLITYVRDPYVRLLSCYLDKFRLWAGNKNRDAHIRKAAGLRPREQIGFAEFVDIVNGQTPEQMEVHWKPQTHIIRWGELEYDVLGKLEAFDAGVEALAGKGIDLRPFISERPHAMKAGARMEDYYTPEIRDKVRRIYACDFEAFGYSAD